MEESLEDHRERGNALFKAGRYAGAWDQYTEALKYDSTIKRGHLQRDLQ